MVEKQLIILLNIIVRLIIVEVHFSILIRIDVTTRIISSAEFLHFLFRSIVPSMISALFPGKSYQFDRSVITIIAPLQIVGIKSNRSPVNITIRGYI